MKKLNLALITLLPLITLIGSTQPAQALSAGDVSSFSTQALQFIAGIALAVSAVLIIRSGYIYITSTGHPEALDSAKRGIKNTLIGLVIVLSASVLVSILSSSYQGSTQQPGSQTIPLTDIQTTEQSGLTQVLLDAISGFLKDVVDGAVKPLTDSVINFLTSTPLMSTNPTIFNFWLIMTGITDSLFVVFIALMGLHLMSAEALGFEEVPLRILLPRVMLAFLGANISIFLIDWVIRSANALNGTIISLTGGLTSSWIFYAFDPAAIVTGSTALITLIFLTIFMILVILLILFYISRIIIISVGAVLSPLICLLWLLPKTASLAEVLTKGYLVTIYSVFIQVVTIQLASAVLAAPTASSPNPIISILIAIGLLLTLLKTPPLLLQLTIHSTQNMTYAKLGGQVINILTRAPAKPTPRREFSTS